MSDITFREARDQLLEQLSRNLDSIHNVASDPQWFHMNKDTLVLAMEDLQNTLENICDINWSESRALRRAKQ